MWLCEFWKKAVNLTKIILRDDRALKYQLICWKMELKIKLNPIAGVRH